MAGSETENQKQEKKPEEVSEFIDESEVEDATSPAINPIPSVESFRKELYRYFTFVLVFIPLALVPTIIVFIRAGQIKFTKLVPVIIQRETSLIISQSGIFLAATLLAWALAQALSILIPYLQLRYRKKLSESSYKRLSCLFAIRKYIKMTLFFLGMLLVMTRIVYDTTLLDKILEVISKRVEGKESVIEDTTKQRPMPLLYSALFYIERIHICVIVFSILIAGVEYLIAAAQYALHKVTFGKRIGQANTTLRKVAHLYNKVVPTDVKITYTNGESDESQLLPITSVHFKSSRQAQVIGKMLFTALAKNKPSSSAEEPKEGEAATSPEITLDVNDIEGFTEGEQQELFNILKGDKNGKSDITKQDVSESMIAFYEERQNIVKSLKSNAYLLKKLHRILFTMGIVIAALLCTPFLDIGVTTAWAGFLGLFSALSFASQSLARTCFDSMMFIFVLHTFDIGDILIIDGDTLVSEFIEVFTCHFSKVDQKGEKTLLYIPSSSLFSKTITNISRSKRNGQQERKEEMNK